MTYTAHTDFEHPVTGDMIEVTVMFEMHPPEPDIGIFASTPKVLDYTHNGAPLTTDQGAVDDHVDGLSDEWLSAEAQEQDEAASDDYADWKRELIHDRT